MRISDWSSDVCSSDLLFPLGVGPETVLLGRIAAGVVWVAALLATLLALDRLFAKDYEDGSLDLLVLSPLPLEAKIGRASCRDRVCQYVVISVVAVSLKQKPTIKTHTYNRSYRK